jgi:haloalkane dehalogenase
MPILRTPDERFDHLPDWNYPPQYITLNGLRIHYVEVGNGGPILCLHGEPTWSYLYRKMIPTLSAIGRVIALDWVGFGRSDKYTEIEEYSYQMHHDMLMQFILDLNLTDITLVCQDWGGLLGLPIATELPERFSRLVIMNTGLPTGETQPAPAFLRWRDFAARVGRNIEAGRIVQLNTVSKVSPEVITAYNAPFPDASYRAGVASFPLLVPINPDDIGAAEMRATRDRLSTWDKPALVMFSDKDPVTAGGDRYFRNLIPTANDQPFLLIEDAGHFLQEDKGEEIARHIVDFIRRT